MYQTILLSSLQLLHIIVFVLYKTDAKFLYNNKDNDAKSAKCSNA